VYVCSVTNVTYYLVSVNLFFAVFDALDHLW
jgi:hypothetical protein